MNARKRSKGTIPSRRCRTARPIAELLEERLAPAIFNVLPTVTDGSVGSLRYAIDQANGNHDASNTINLAAGNYQLTDTTDGNLLIQDDAGIPSKTLNIIGVGETKSFIEPASGSWQTRIFQVIGKTRASVSVVFSNLQISGGKAHDGGAVGGTAALGGGLLIQGANVTLKDVWVNGNSARGGLGAHGLPGVGSVPGGPGGAGGNAKGGGIYLAGGKLTLIGSVLNEDSADGGSGGAGGGGGPGNSSAGQTGSAGSAGAAGKAGINGENGGNGGPGGNGTKGGEAGKATKPPLKYGAGGAGGAGGSGSGGGIFVAGGTVVISGSSIQNDFAFGGPGGAGGAAGAVGIDNGHSEPAKGGQGGSGGAGGIGGGGGHGLGSAGTNGGNGGKGGNGATGGAGGTGATGFNGAAGGAGGAGGNGSGGGLYISGGTVILTLDQFENNQAGGGVGGLGGIAHPGFAGGTGGGGGPGGKGNAGGGGGEGEFNKSGKTGSGGNGATGGNGGTGGVGGKGGKGGDGGDGGDGGKGGNGMGGAIYIGGGTLSLTTSTLAGNEAFGGHGGRGSAGAEGGGGGLGGAGRSGGQGGLGGNAGLPEFLVTGADVGKPAIGGKGGIGGAGGVGNAGGDGGAGGAGGAGGDGDGGALAMNGETTSVTLIGNTFSANTAMGGAGGIGGQGGNGGVGGPGGQGGQGGQGGFGGNGNNGANGGDGRTGGDGGVGGDGGKAGVGGDGGMGGTGRGGAIYVVGGSLSFLNGTVAGNTVQAGAFGAGGGAGNVIFMLSDGSSGIVTRGNYGLGGHGESGGAGGFGGLPFGNGVNGAKGKKGASGVGADHGQTGTAQNGGVPGKLGAALGGGMFINSGTITLNHATVALNKALDPPGGSSFSGGGVFASGSGGVTASSCLFGGNSATKGPDVSGSVTATNSLFQTAPTGTLTGSKNLTGVNPGLNPAGLQNLGGPTETIALTAASPALGKAGNPRDLYTDQRGYDLPGGAAPDIGAFQVGAVADTTPPTATLSAPTVTAANALGLSPYPFTITFTDNTAVSLASLTGADVQVVAPNGVAIDADLESVTPSGHGDALGDAPSLVATYQISPPGGTWAASPLGTYSVTLAGAPVTDLAGNAIATSSLGEFSVLVGTPVAQATTIALNASANPSSFGQTVDVTAVVGPQSGTGVPTGTVTFTIDGGTPTSIALQQVGTSDQATFVLPALPAGTHTITAVYNGDASFTASSTVSISQTISVPPAVPTIIGEMVLSNRKLNKKHKPVGKPVLAGFVLDYSAAMDPATAGNAANYHVDWTSTKRVKRKTVKVLHPIPFRAVYNAANNSVSLLLSRKQAFAQGGQITVIAAPPGGVSSASGVLLDGNDEGHSGDNGTLAILSRARGIDRDSTG